MGITLSLLLISTVSAMLMAGPRVLQVIGQDFHLLVVSQNKSRRYPHDCDLGGCTAQCGVVLSSSFESVLVFSGFILALNTFFAVGGIFVLRAGKSVRERQSMVTEPGGIPTPLLYLALTGWTLVFIFIERPSKRLRCIDDRSGLGLYWFSERKGGVS